MFCSNCGVKNDAGVKFCSGCGKPIGESAQSAPAPAAPAAAAQPTRCPACRAPIESFQTRCSSCGSELVSAQSGESVASFFKKLDELTEREYAANKSREGAAGKKAKKKQPKIVVLCEVVAVISIILLLLQLTPLPGMLKPEEVSFAFDAGTDNIVYFISNDSEYSIDETITLTILDRNRNPIERSITQIDRWEEERISTTADHYLIHIKDGGGNDFYFPSSRTPTRMSGTIYLSFNGDRIARYALLRNGDVRFE